MNKRAHQHCLLAEHGGAARVRQLLSRELPALGWSVSDSYEICDFEPAGAEAAAEAAAGEGVAGEAENPALSGGNSLRQLDPAELGKTAGLALLCHLHSTADWPLACASLKAAGSPAFPVVVTLHDSGLLDGPGLLPERNFPAIAPAARLPGNYPPSPSIGDNPDTPYGPPAYPPCSAAPAARPPAFRPDSSVPLQEEAGESAQLRALLALRAWLVSPSAWLAGRLKKASGCSCRVIPNGVEPNPFDAQTARQRLGLMPNARMVLFTAHGGVLAGLKGAARWPHIWQAVKRAVPAAVGFMVGGETMRHHRDADLFEWPYVDREKMALLMAAADLLIYPSLADNHPLVVLEALSGGTAVSSYCVGGIPEQIRPGKTGLLAPVGDEAALIANSIRILSAPGWLREMGRAGRESWERHFRARQMAEKYAALYEQIIGSGLAGGPQNRCLPNCGLQGCGRGNLQQAYRRERP